LVYIISQNKNDKELDIIVLRQQVPILQRKVKTPPRITDPEGMILAILTDRYNQSRMMHASDAFR
jgi:hypothetical protein